MRKLLVFLATGLFLCAISSAQDQQSLGDVARQARAKKQATPAKEAKDPQSVAPGATPKKSHVITDEEIPSQKASPKPSADESTKPASDSQPSAGDKDAQAEQWKSQIQQLKAAITSMQSEINELGASIHYAGANCVSNCAQWNERQQQKQERLEAMKAQLEEQQKRLEEMQETARKQGFGSSVYEP